MFARVRLMAMIALVALAAAVVVAGAITLADAFQSQRAVGQAISGPDRAPALAHSPEPDIKPAKHQQDN